MKYYYKDQLVKKSKKMEYKFTIVKVDTDYAAGAFTSYEQAWSYLRQVSRMRADYTGESIEQARKVVFEKNKICEFTRIEA